jgi:crotonobetainyl-CoA:carnitine CoA-transferase CaiB-like acyl-CoA transferase
MSETPAAACPQVASLGENSEEILAELGYSASQIAALISPAKSEARA